MDENSQEFLVIFPNFFENNYSNNELDGAIVLFGSCEIFGNNDKECLALYKSLKKSGASTLIGFCNSVDQNYSLLFNEKIINCLLRGKTIGSAFEEAKTLFGENVIEYYKKNYIDFSLEENPAFPILKGLTNKKLIYSDLDNWGGYSFTIKDIDSKLPIKDVRIAIQNSKNNNECIHLYRSSEKGNVSVKLPNGKYTCELVHPNYQKASYDITIQNDMLTNVFEPVYMTKKSYSWLVEPTIEADDIIVFDESYVPNDKVKVYSGGTDTTKEFTTADRKDYSIIKKDNRYGFIGYEGNMLSDIDNEGFFSCECGEVGLIKGDKHPHLDSNLKLIEENAWLGHGTAQHFLYYSKKSGIFSNFALPITKNDDIYIDELDMQPDLTQYGNTYVQKVTLNKFNKVSENDSVYYKANIGSLGKYALTNGKVTTDYIFDDVLCASNTAKANSKTCDNSLAACKKDGKWGYYDFNGNEIISCQFDDAVNMISDSGNEKEQHNAYLPTEGYIAVNKDGGYGYYNTDGKEVIPCGEFEQARPVYDGRAWVKKNGKWGVIKLK